MNIWRPVVGIVGSDFASAENYSSIFAKSIAQSNNRLAGK